MAALVIAGAQACGGLIAGTGASMVGGVLGLSTAGCAGNVDGNTRAFTVGSSAGATALIHVSSRMSPSFALTARAAGTAIPLATMLFWGSKPFSSMPKRELASLAIWALAYVATAIYSPTYNSVTLFAASFFI